MSNMSRKELLLCDKEYLLDTAKIVLAIKMPNGSTELIVNQNALDKLNYIENAYDDNLCLKTNNEIKIVNYMIYD